MPTPGATLRAARALPGGRNNAPQQVQGFPLEGQSAQSYASAYSTFLPRPAATFTEGAMGPFSPILPTPLDQPDEGADRPGARRFEYEVGWNLPVGQPGSEGLKLVSFDTLKTLADLYSVARSCIQLRKAEIRGLDWDIIPTHEAAKAYHGDRDLMKDFGERRAKLIRFFRQPDPDYFSFGTWMDALLEEVFVYDALSLLMRPKWGKGLGKGVLGSDLDSLELISGQTIRPLLGLHGEVPRPPAPAYQQYLFGVPRSDYMTMITHRDLEEGGLTNQQVKEFRGDQLLYIPMTPRRWTPYGFPPVERALIPIMSGLQKQAYQMAYFREGTVPEVFISPGDASLTPNQLRELQDALNAFAGDPSWHHKCIVLPPGSRVDPMKTKEIADQFDEIVMSQVTMAFDVNPMEIGLLPRVSTVASPFAAREMAQASKTIHERTSTKPMLKFLADIFDGIMHRVIGADDMKFTFEGLTEEAEQNAMTQLLVQQVQNGIRSVDEARDELELEPWGLAETSGPVFFTGQGPVPFGQVQVYPDENGQGGGTADKPDGENSETFAHGQSDVAQDGDKEPPTPAHDAARAGMNIPSIRPGGRPGGPPGPSEGDSANASATPHLMKAQSAELEALGRHIKKGRDPLSWQLRYLPAHAPQLAAAAVAGGARPIDLPATLAPLILAKAEITDWPGWQHDQELASAYTPKVQNALLRAAGQAEKLIRAWWSGELAATRPGLIALISNRIEESVAKVLQPLWREAWYLGDRAADAVVKSESPDWAGWKPGQPATVRLIKSGEALNALLAAHGISVVKAISATRMGNLNTAISAAVSAGQNPGSLASQLPALLGIPSRADLIARTEVARASEAAALERFRERGVPYKRWMIRPGSEPCKLCAANRGEGILPLSAAFTDGSVAGPAHPRCTCAVLPAGPRPGSDTLQIGKRIHAAITGERLRDDEDENDEDDTEDDRTHSEPGRRFRGQRGGSRSAGGGSGMGQREMPPGSSAGTEPPRWDASMGPGSGYANGELNRVPGADRWPAAGNTQQPPGSYETERAGRNQAIPGLGSQRRETSLNDGSTPRRRRGKRPPDAADAAAQPLGHRGRPPNAVGKAAADAWDANPVEAEHVKNQMRKNYPDKALGWMDDAHWIGPVEVPLDRIDYDDRHKWAASHQPEAVRQFAKDIKHGRGHTQPVVAVQEPGEGKVKIIDGHHRTLAYQKLGRTVRAYIGFVGSNGGPWDKAHLYQLHQGSDPQNKTASRKKVSKDSVDFRVSHDPQRRCGTCVMYDDHTCDLVAGVINPGNVCDRWQAKGG